MLTRALPSKIGLPAIRGGCAMVCVRSARVVPIEPVNPAHPYPPSQRSSKWLWAYAALPAVLDGANAGMRSVALAGS